MLNDLEKIIITKEQIAVKVKELADMLTEDYTGKNPLLISILKGSVIFFSDLVRELPINIQADFLAVSSYGQNSKSSGEVRLVKDIETSIEDRHVIIVEDIIDTGRSLSYLKRMLYQRGPSSIKICALLDKRDGRETDIDPDYTGFIITDSHFLVGYGLDFAEKYRNLKDIWAMKLIEK